MQLRHEPAVLVLSRQALPTIDRTKYAAGIRRRQRRVHSGRRRRRQAGRHPHGHRQRSFAVRRRLRNAHRPGHQGPRGQHALVGYLRTSDRANIATAFCHPSVTARVSVEQASTLGWDRYVGSKGKIIGMHTFGASAPLKELQKKFGFEPDKVVATVKEVLGK